MSEIIIAIKKIKLKKENRNSVYYVVEPYLSLLH